VSQPAWIDEYWERGFVRIPAVFPAQEIAALAGYFDEILERATGLKAIAKQGLTEFRVVPIAGKPTLKFAKWASASHAGLNAFRTSRRLLDLVTRLLGPDLNSITNQMHYKNPGDGVSFQMHQDCAFRKPDAAYRDLWSNFLQTAIAVDPATVENGCLQLVPYSHRDRKNLLEGGYEGWEANGANDRVLAGLPPAENGLMDPGDVLIWNPYTIHGSQPNRSARSRRVYINGFARSEATDHGVRALEAGKVVDLRWGPETRWDVVEER
jgi:ectoine hydroxylase-related dioxygenase (phytanoyl-CoA dioxygenase family)